MAYLLLLKFHTACMFTQDKQPLISMSPPLPCGLADQVQTMIGSGVHIYWLVLDLLRGFVVVCLQLPCEVLLG